MSNRAKHPAAGLRVLAALLALATSQPALAGPPYVTDDPQSTGYGHYEV